MSSKTRIHEKLTQLRKIMPEKPSTTLELKHFDMSSHHGDNKVHDNENESSLNESSYQHSTIENENSVPDYLITRLDLEIPSLFEKLK